MQLWFDFPMLQSDTRPTGKGKELPPADLQNTLKSSYFTTTFDIEFRS